MMMEDAQVNKLETNEVLHNALLRQSFYSAMLALLARADAIRTTSPHMAMEDMVAIGYMLHHLDPHDEIRLFDDVRQQMA